MIDMDVSVPQGPEAAEILLAPGVEYQLGVDECEMTPEGVAGQNLFGFSASLKAEVAVGDCFVYIFDRGPNAGYANYAAVPPNNKNADLYPEDRYIVVTDDGISDLNAAVTNGGDADALVGWAHFTAGEEFVVGTNELSASVLNDGLNDKVSENHLRIVFGEDGTLGLTDLGSIAGSRIMKDRTAETTLGASEEDLSVTDDNESRTTAIDYTKTISVEDLSDDFWSDDDELEDIANAGKGDLIQARNNGTEDGTDEILWGPEKAREVDLGVAERPRGAVSEDTMLVNTRQKIYAVFDGVGGVDNGTAASRTAAEALNRYMSQAIDDTQTNYRDLEHELVQAFGHANEQVRKHADGGMTTAVAAFIREVRDGQQYVSWASVGDSRLYVYNDITGGLEQITQDEIASPERANVITNCMGYKRDMPVHQYGTFMLGEGDRLILCSDGITGDFEPDILKDHEVAAAMRGTSDNQTAADNLLKVSRKHDDKSVIVVSY